MVHIEYTHPDGRRQTIRKNSPVQTRRGAEQYEREVRQALADGTYGVVERTKASPSLTEFADEYLKNYVIPNNKQSVVADKRGHLKRRILPAFGQLKLDQIGRRQIDSLTASLQAEQLAPNTINNYLVTLGNMLTVASDWGLCDPPPKIKKLRSAAQWDCLDSSESERLLSAISPEPAWQTTIFVALRTGLRLGELIGLQWTDIDTKAGRLVVQRSASRGVLGTPKSGAHREVPLSPQTVEALKAHRHLRGLFVFCRENGDMLSPDHCRPPLRRAYKRAGLRQIGWHTLRHTFASQLVRRGRSMKEVQELLGHASVQTTMRYAHLSPECRRDAVEVLDDPPNSTTTAQAQRTK